MLKNISIIFLSIFFESLPFLLLGAVISSIIEEFVSDEKLIKLIPKNVILSSLVGVFLGFFLPACDCAVIPISKRLIKKKVPLNVAISFMLSSPIINPVVLLSTYYAFYNTNSKIFFYRFFLGILISLIIGIIMGLLFKNKNVLKNNDCCCNCNHDHIDDDFKELEKHTINYENRFVRIIKCIGEDLFDVLKYLMIGGLIASIVQVLLPVNVINFFNNNDFMSIVVLILFAYLVSLCSTSDYFVGKSFLGTFSSSGVIAYLILGPMIDIKNTIVLYGNYQKKFVFVLIGLIFFFVLTFSLLVGLL